MVLTFRPRSRCTALIGVFPWVPVEYNLAPSEVRGAHPASQDALMRNRLYSAWIRVLLFWWIVAAVGWAFSNEEIAHSAKHLEVLVFNAPVTALNAAWVAGRVLSVWSARVLVVTLGAIALGAGITYIAQYLARRRPLWALRSSGKRLGRRGGRLRQWQGIEITLGALPRPQWAPGVIHGVAVEGLDGLGLPTAQERLLREVLSWVAKQKNAYVGPGHTPDLLDHTLGVVNRIAVDCREARPEELGLLLVLAAAHDAGKALVWERAPNGAWRRTGWHDEAGARLLSQMSGFANLEQEDQRLAVLVLAFAHKPSKAPAIPQALQQRYNWMKARLEGADRKATHAEQQSTLAHLDKHEKDDLLLEALAQALRTLHFQVPGIKPGLRASAWRKGNRVYLLEPGMRTAVLKALPEAVRGAYGGDYRRKGALAPVMSALLAVLAKKGWVVTEHDGLRADPPLWRLRSGSKDFSGVIALDLPDEATAGLPRDTHFAVTLLDPVFPSPRAAAPSPPAGPADGTPAGPADGTPSVQERSAPSQPATSRAGATGRRRPNQAELGELAARTGISVEELRKRLQNPHTAVAHPPAGGNSSSTGSVSEKPAAAQQPLAEVIRLYPKNQTEEHEHEQ